MELLDYEKAPFPLTDAVKVFFEKKEKELKTSIKLVWGNGATIDRSHDDGFDGIVVYDWGTHSGNNRTIQVNKIIKKDGTQIKIPVFDYGLTADESLEIHDYNKFTLANYDYMTVWCLWPLCNFDDEKVLEELFAEPLKKCLKKDIFEKRVEKAKAKAREKFFAKAATSTQSDLSEVSAKIRINKRKVSEAESVFFQLTKKNESLIAQETKLKELVKDQSGFMNEQLDALEKNPKYDKIDFNEKEGCLEVFTRGLYLYSPNREERTYLGRFKIKLWPDTGQMYLINQDNQRAGWEHPHVQNGGAPCWGDAYAAIGRFVAAGDLVGAFEYCCNYLETYNVIDAYAKVAYYWFSAQPIEKLVQKTGEYKIPGDDKADEEKAKKEKELSKAVG